MKEETKNARNSKNSSTADDENHQSPTSNCGGSPIKSNDDEVTLQDMEVRVVNIEKLYCNKYHTELISVPLGVISIIENLISGI